MNGVGETADPKGVVSLMGPVVAPSGTWVVRKSGVAARTGAATPLKDRILGGRLAEPGAHDSHLPPMGPSGGFTRAITTGPVVCGRRMARIFPTASYS